MTAPPLVSFVLPAFNASETIRESIDSVLRQTYGNVEVLVGDDGSRDDTARIVTTYGLPQVRLIQNDMNLGPGSTRDKLIAMAKGEWIAFLDADDVIQEDRVLRMLDAAAGRQGIVYDDVMLCHDSPKGLKPYRRLRNSHLESPGLREIPFADFVRQRKLMIHPLVSRAAILSTGAMHNDGRYGEDSNFFLSLAARGTPLFYLPEALYYYRLTPGSATHNRERQRLLREQIERVLDEPTLRQEDRSAILDKIAMLRREEAYDMFLASLRSGHFGSGIWTLLRQPKLGTKLAARLWADLGYHVHRLLHSGRTR
jgi:succinoglycan biosynthesis protein ExoO